MMFSLFILTVPFAGKAAELVTLITVSTTATAALVVDAAVSKSEADVRSIEVTLEFIPPSKVVWEYVRVSPPK